MEKVENKLTYAKAYAEIAGIMQGLQKDKISVDDLSAAVKRAVTPITFCNEMLRSTEAEVGALVKKLGH